MKRIAIISLFVLTLVVLIGCTPEEKEPFFCGCSDCERLAIECSEECAYALTGKCSCEGCSPKVVGKDKYVIGRKDVSENQSVSKIVVYPQLQNLENKTLEDNINKAIRSSYEPYTKELILMSEGFVAGEEEEADSMVENKVFRYNVDYESYLLDDKYLSLIINHSINTGAIIFKSPDGKTMITDGIRSNNWDETYLIDVLDPYRNEALTIFDICSDSITEADIVDEINRQAQQRSIEIFLGKGLERLAKNQKFYIDSDSQKLVVYFEPGAITKFSVGSVIFEMPFRYNQSSQKFEK